MSQNINYWDCKFNNYEEYWDGEDEARVYMCAHPNGNGMCDLENKWCGRKAVCELLDDETKK